VRHSRMAVVVAVLAGHLALIDLLLWAIRGAPDSDTPRQRRPPLMALLLPRTGGVDVEHSSAPTHATSGPRATSPAHHADVRSPVVHESSSVSSVPGPGTQEARPPPSIDWALQGERAAADTAQRLIETEQIVRRQAEALIAGTRPPPGWSITRSPSRTFRWSTQAHHFELTPQGALAFHLNDHCVVGLFLILPFFGCAIGKIPTHGDLFDGMHGAVRYDDSKDR